VKLRAPLATARGLGSAKEGTHHFWNQRLTAIVLVPMTLWIMVSLVRMTNVDYATVTQWIAAPLNAVLLLIFLLALFYHALLGVQIVIEDYIHSEWQKIACLILVKFTILLTGLTSVLAVIKVFLGL
jgi:succinate dehydrogenase / fumarate reductase, membrane anchor subunit